MAIKLLLGTAALSLMLDAQAGPLPSVLPDWISGASRLGLDGALMVALVIVWRAYQAKDALLVESTKAVTAALQQAAASNAELRGIITESVDASRTLRESIDKLALSIQKNSGTSSR